MRFWRLPMAPFLMDEVPTVDELDFPVLSLSQEDPPSLYELFDLFSDFEDSEEDLGYVSDLDALFPESMLTEPAGPETDGIDLFCHETLEDSPPVCQAPDIPGVKCESCDFHRRLANDETVYCALCYMRLTAYCVYSKYDSVIKIRKTVFGTY